MGSFYNSAITFCCLIGLGLSIYAYVVELAASQDEKYQAMCDLGEHMSCTKAFRSPYGKGFGLVSRFLGEDHVLNKPNSLLGIIFYSLTATLAQSNSVFITRVSLLGVILSNLASMYFAYILYFILQDLCVVCVSTYVVNFLNLLLVYRKLAVLKKEVRVDNLKKRL